MGERREEGGRGVVVEVLLGGERDIGCKIDTYPGLVICWREVMLVVISR